MIQINLMPLTERTIKWPLLRIFLIAGIIVGVIFSSIYSYNLYTIWCMERIIVNLNNQYELLRPTQAKIMIVSGKQQAIVAKNNILIGLTNERKSWHTIITHLGVAVTSQMGLTELTIADNNMLKIKGVTNNYSEVVRFLQTIEQDKIFEDPVLLKAESNFSALQVAKFEMTVKLKGMK
jgi:type IV pilus assembly protein PilN